MRAMLVKILITAVLVGCAPATVEMSPTPTLATLQVFHTRTPSLPPPAGEDGTITPLPSATPTPRTYTVQLNDTYGTLATRFGVTVNALVAANPEIDPNALIVGMVLIIPAEQQNDEAGVPTPTAVSIQVNPPHCLATAEGGAWCFSEVTNPQPFAVESVLVRFRISAGGEILQTRLAATPLDFIPAGGSLPVGVYFPPPVPEDVLVGVELAAALPLDDPSARYLLVALEDVTTETAPNRLSATVRGMTRNQEAERGAKSVWVLAAARDRQGRVSGIRRWEWQGELAPGEAIPFSLIVYSQLKEVERVDLYVEAKP